MKKLVLLFCFAFIACAQKEQTKSLKIKPNIVFILSDDHATNAISAYNDMYRDMAATPNIDRIANEGALLRNVFSTNAICGPSRASILTGKYSHKNGYYKNFKGGHFNGDQWTFPKAFQKSGYTTAIIGKWHLSSIPQGFDYYKYHIDHGEQGVYWDPTYNENGVEVKEKGYTTNITTDFALEWMKGTKKNKPFCLLLNYKAPHREWSPDTKYKDLWKNKTLPFPSTFYDDYRGRMNTAGDTHMTMDFLSRRDLKLKAPSAMNDKKLGQWMGFGNKPDEVVLLSDTLQGIKLKEWKFQKYIKDYLATVKSVDDNIGRVLNYLRENNLEENTIVVYASDQGFFLGDHGWFDKRFMYEESMRMPFLIKYPQKIRPITVLNDVISNIDIAPTLLEMAGAKVPSEVQGKSFYSILKGETSNNWRQTMYYHYYEFPFWHHVRPHYGIRTDRYKLIRFYYDFDIWEFYDLKTDPSELNNLISSREHAFLIDSLKIELKELKEGYGNNMSIEELKKISDSDYGGLESLKNKK